MSDDSKPPNLATTPPPAGEDDLYSASTVVGQASAELLALVRAAEEGNADSKAAAKLGTPASKLATPVATSTEDAKLTAMKEVAARAAKEAAANEVAREAKKAASARPPGPAAAS